MTAIPAVLALLLGSKMSLSPGLLVVAGLSVFGFVFAVIHPQGLIAIPSLMAIAFGLTFVREWRGTLIPGMVTHGLHNGVLLLIALYIFEN